jgi:nucleotide-binding universal stress UspA family protein
MVGRLRSFGSRFMKIVVALDLSPFSKTVLEQAEAIATACSASLLITHVAAPEPDFVGYEPGPQYVRDSRAKELRSEHDELQRMSADSRARGLDARALLIEGPTAETILSVAKDESADLIIVGSHGRSALTRVLLGSISTELVHHSTIPLLVVPMPGRGDS